MNEAIDFLPTRLSLLSRLKNWDDQEGWQVFFDTYWRLIFHTAIKSGLTDAEAQDVVQETIICVMKDMPKSKYDAKQGSFKSWLLRLTKWRIADQFAKRQQGIEPQSLDSALSADTATMDRVPDPRGLELESVWDEEWERNLVEAAVERIKRKVDPKQYQIFDLHVIKDWPVAKVARTLKVSSGMVYLCKHRINSLLKKEIDFLQKRMVC